VIWFRNFQAATLLDRDGEEPREMSCAGADDFAAKAIFAICRSGVDASEAGRLYDRCRCAIGMGSSVRIGFRHPGKAEAIDFIWRERERLAREFEASEDKLSFLTTLPWIGEATGRRLARSLGLLDAEDSGVRRGPGRAGTTGKTTDRRPAGQATTAGRNRHEVRRAPSPRPADNSFWRLSK